jgi:hypothetical protein
VKRRCAHTGENALTKPRPNSPRTYPILEPRGNRTRHASRWWRGFPRHLISTGVGPTHCFATG